MYPAKYFLPSVLLYSLQVFLISNNNGQKELKQK
jgi:hypothetical protein